MDKHLSIGIDNLCMAMVAAAWGEAVISQGPDLDLRQWCFAVVRQTTARCTGDEIVTTDLSNQLRDLGSRLDIGDRYEMAVDLADRSALAWGEVELFDRCVAWAGDQITVTVVAAATQSGLRIRGRVAEVTAAAFTAVDDQRIWVIPFSGIEMLEGPVGRSGHPRARSRVDERRTLAGMLRGYQRQHLTAWTRTAMLPGILAQCARDHCDIDCPTGVRTVPYRALTAVAVHQVQACE